MKKLLDALDQWYGRRDAKAARKLTGLQLAKEISWLRNYKPRSEFAASHSAALKHLEAMTEGREA